MQSVTTFIAELITRFFSQKPKFFTIVQVIAAIFAALNVTLSQLSAAGVLDPANKVVSALSSGIAMAIAITTGIVAQLPKKDANAVAATTTTTPPKS